MAAEDSAKTKKTKWAFIQSDDLPEGLMNNFAVTNNHPLSDLQVEAMNKVNDFFVDANMEGRVAALVLPQAKDNMAVLPLIPYLLQATRVLVLTSDTKRMGNQFGGKRPLLVQQGVLTIDEYAPIQPHVKVVTQMFSAKQKQEEEDEHEMYDVLVANPRKMLQPTDEVGEDCEPQFYEIAPTSLLPLSMVDLVIVDKAASLNVAWDGYIPDLVYEAQQANPDVKIVCVDCKPPSQARLEHMLLRLKPKQRGEDDDEAAAEEEEDIDDEEDELEFEDVGDVTAQILYCGNSDPKTRPKLVRQKKVQVAEEDADDDSKSASTVVAPQNTGDAEVDVGNLQDFVNNEDTDAIDQAELNELACHFNDDFLDANTDDNICDDEPTSKRAKSSNNDATEVQMVKFNDFFK